MADGGTGEKTEEASPQKLKQARDKGQVAKSQDAVQALSFVIVFSVMALTLSSTAQTLRDFLATSIDSAVRRGDDLPTVLDVTYEALWMVLRCSLPALGAAFLAGIAANYMQVGFLVTTEPLKPDIKKLNPVDGFKNLFSKKKLIESLKQLVKFVLVSYIAYATVRDSLREVVLSTRIDLWTGVYVGGQIILTIAKKIGLLFVVVAIADFFWQRHQFNKEMMMSKYDVKQEYKQSEGDPHAKAERKALAEELILHGSQQNVANADAVVVNPAHVAVAIKYDREKGGAPRVVAKGMRKNAETIKEIARQAGVPILRNVPLAQALSKLDLEEEIPEELYEAVAEVLNFVYEMKENERKSDQERRQRAVAQASPEAPRTTGNAQTGNAQTGNAQTKGNDASPAKGRAVATSRRPGR
jgi:flagellar biosynthetic protein FlhB